MPFKQYMLGGLFGAIGIALIWLGTILTTDKTPIPDPVVITIPTIPTSIQTLEFITIETSNWVEVTVDTNVIQLVDWDWAKQTVNAVFSYDYKYSLGFDFTNHDWQPEPDNVRMILQLCAPSLIVTNLNTKPELDPVAVQGLTAAIFPQFVEQNPDVITKAREARDNKIKEYMTKLSKEPKLQEQALKSLKSHLWNAIDMANKDSQILNNIEFKSESECSA